MDGVIRPGATAPREQVTRAYGWLTVEVGAYAALMGVGLLLRLLRLGGALDRDRPADGARPDGRHRRHRDVLAIRAASNRFNTSSEIFARYLP